MSLLRLLYFDFQAVGLVPSSGLQTITLCVFITVAKIYAAETPVLEMGRILKNKLSPLRVKQMILSSLENV